MAKYNKITGHWQHWVGIALNVLSAAVLVFYLIVGIYLYFATTGTTTSSTFAMTNRLWLLLLKIPSAVVIVIQVVYWIFCIFTNYKYHIGDWVMLILEVIALGFGVGVGISWIVLWYLYNKDSRDLLPADPDAIHERQITATWAWLIIGFQIGLWVIHLFRGGVTACAAYQYMKYDSKKYEQNP